MNIMIAGEGGQGIQLIAKILSDIAYEKGYKVSLIPHYGVEMRMGISFAYIRISKKEISYPKFEKADIVAVLAKRQLEIPIGFIAKNTRVINVTDLNEFFEKNKISPRNLNLLTLGIILKDLNTTDFRIELNKAKNVLKDKFKNTSGLEDLLRALEMGFTLEQDYYNNDLNKIKKDIYPIHSISDNKKEHSIFSSYCKGCGLCIEKCPVKALGWSSEELNYISKPMPDVDIEKCINCGTCERICPDSAIKIKSK